MSPGPPHRRPPPWSACFALLALAGLVQAIAAGHRLPGLIEQGEAYWPLYAIQMVLALAGALAAVALARRARAGWSVRPAHPWRWLRLGLYGVALSSILACSGLTWKSEAAFLTGLEGLAALALLALWRGWALPDSPWFVRLDRLAFQSLVVLVGLEAALSAIAPLRPGLFWLRQTERGQAVIDRMRQAPGTPYLGGVVNPQGYFDDPFQEEKPPGVWRLGVLCDSFGVTIVPRGENFPDRLEAGLGPGREVYNFGIQGIGPSEYLHLLRTTCPRYQIDHVLLAFFVGNDLARHYADEPWQRLHRPESWYLHALATKLRLLGHAPGLGGRAKAPGPDEPTYSEEEFLAIQGKRLRNFQRSPDRKQRSRIRDTLADLEAIASAAQGRLTVLIIPDQTQVDDELWAGITAGMRAESLDRDQPQRLIGGFFRERGVSVVDPLERLREAQRQAPVYHLRDTHWNARGHAIAAEMLLPAIQGRVKP